MLAISALPARKNIAAAVPMAVARMAAISFVQVTMGRLVHAFGLKQRSTVSTVRADTTN